MSDQTPEPVDTASESPMALVDTTENLTALADPFPGVGTVQVVPAQVTVVKVDP